MEKQHLRTENHIPHSFIWNDNKGDTGYIAWNIADYDEFSNWDWKATLLFKLWRGTLKGIWCVRQYRTTLDLSHDKKQNYGKMSSFWGSRVVQCNLVLFRHRRFSEAWVTETLPITNSIILYPIMMFVVEKDDTVATWPTTVSIILRRGATSFGRLQKLNRWNIVDYE